VYNLWLVWRYLRSRQKFLNLTTSLSILGMVIGVASLVVAMAVVSGFETTLKNSVIDSVGHVLIMKRGGPLKNDKSFLEQVRQAVPAVVAETPFVYLEAMLVHKKKLSGVVVQGIDPNTYSQVLRLEQRLKKGEFVFGPNADGVQGGLIGKGLAEKFGLKIGDVFKAVTPVAREYDNALFSPRLKKFFVRGILDLGRYDWNQRVIITHIEAAQDFAKIGSQVMGYRLRLSSDEKAKEAAFLLSQKLGHTYWTRDWEDVNRNLFEAVRLEKVIIFFILLIMVIAACFNISSTLFVSVLKRFGDISILKTLGANRKFLVKLFTIQGLLIGFIGSILGICLGVALCFGFLYLEREYGLLPGEVYKLEEIDAEFRWLDISLILVASLFICYLATLVPARRGAKLSPIEGLRYE